MSRSISIFALLCTITYQGLSIKASNETTISNHTIETSLPNPTTVLFDSTLYTISKTNRTLSVNSSETKCKLNVDPFDESIQGRIKASALKKTRKIIVWGIQSSSNFQKDVRSTYYTLLIVDPIACNYQVVPLAEDKLPSIWPSILPRVVTYDTQFYLFYPTGEKCSPCLFDSNGKNMGLSANRQLKAPSGVITELFWIEAFHTDAYKYLFHAHNFENGTSIIELVDNYWFKTVKNVQLDHAIDAASIAYGNYQNTAICYISKNDRREVICARLNSRLTPGLSWKLPVKELPVIDVSVDVDELGNTFIGTINSQNLHFYVYNVDGLLVVDIDFGRIGDDNYTRREVNGIRFGDEYCLDALVYVDRDAQDSRNIVRCVDVSGV